MSTATAIRSMLASGLTIEQALIAVEAMEEAAVSARMTLTNAERQAKHRAKKKAEAQALNNKNNVTSVIPVTSVTSVTPTPENTASLARAFSIGEEVSIYPPEKPTVSTPKPEKPISNRQPRGSRLTADWQPNDDDRQFARDRLPTNLACREELGKFREYWLAKPGAGALKLDWSLTWRKWVRTASDRYPRGPPYANGHKPPQTNMAIDALQEILRDDQERNSDNPPH